MASLEASMTEPCCATSDACFLALFCRDTDMDMASVAKDVDFRSWRKAFATATRTWRPRPLPGKENFVQQLKDALSADDVGLRTSVGQSFAQYLRKKP